MSFVDKSVVITGGTSGIGLELIKNLLERGAKNVAILDINDIDGASVKLQAKYPNGQTVLYLKTDVIDRKNVWQSFREAHARFGGIDVVIGNAGIANENLPDLTIQINLIGMLNSTQAAVEFMGKPNGGNGGIVLNIASTFGLDIIGGFPAYTSSKFGVVGLTRSYAADTFKNLGIKFVVVCPGFIHTAIVDSPVEKMLPNTSTKEIETAQSVMGVHELDRIGVCLAEILENPTSTAYIIDAGEAKPQSFPDYWKRF